MTSPLQQKIKITGPSMVTANRTWDGVVIYRTAQQGWSANLSDAAIVLTSDEARTLLVKPPPMTSAPSVPISRRSRSRTAARSSPASPRTYPVGSLTIALPA